MARHRFSNPPFDQINLTPLIDTLFFLLIIFMLTAPLLEYKLDVKPPEDNAETLKPDEYSKTVNVDKHGVIYYESKPVTPETLAKKLASLKNANAKYSFYLRADAELKYGEVIGVLRTIKNAGFSDISLVTAAED